MKSEVCDASRLRVGVDKLLRPDPTESDEGGAWDEAWESLGVSA